MEFAANKVPYYIPVPNNMGIVRYFLAFVVLVEHFNFAFGTGYSCIMTVDQAVGGFFALSGFLVYASFLRHGSVKKLVEGRMRKILPSYFFIVLLCFATLWTVSTVPVGQYFASSDTWRYLAANLTFLNWLGPTLPGVFDGEAVNGALWTMKVEWCLYLSIPIVVWLVRKLRAKPLAVFIVIYFLSAAWRVTFYYLWEATGREMYATLSRQFMGQFMYFYWGVVIYYYFDVFMRCRWAVVALCAGCYLVIPYIEGSYLVLEPLATSSLVLLVSMWGRWGTFEYRLDNVSYNIYLFHFPLIWLAKHFALQEAMPLWGVFVVTTAAVVALAVLSNKLIDQPFRKKKK